MSEIWKPIPSCPGYSASSLGRIRRDECLVAMPRGGHRKRGGLISPQLRKRSPRYQAFIAGKTRLIAPLVCEAFHGPRPFPGALCMHLDEDATNDTPGNLQWGTYRDNANTPKLKDYHRSRTGERHSRCKLSDAAVVAIRQAKGRVAARALAEAHGIRREYVHQLWAGQVRRSAQ